VRSEVRYTFNFRADVAGQDGTITNLGNNPTGLANPEYGFYDGGAWTRIEGKFVPGIFAGVKYQLNKDVVFELALRNFGMFHMDFVPATYKYGGANNPIVRRTNPDGVTRWIFDGVPPEEELGTGTTKLGTTRGTSLEFAIAFRL
jgi:hypothetical protein